MEIGSSQIGDIQALMLVELQKLYPPGEARAMLNQLLFHLTGKSAAQLVLDRERKFSESEIFFLQRALKRLLKHEPLQYITGTAYFSGRDFTVNPDVLIPRPETEELVRWALSDHAGQEYIRILDIGTGSGCIAISLQLELPMAEVHAIDVSEAALAVAAANAKRHHSGVRFTQCNIFDREAWKGMPAFDLIISNPPYITPADRKSMQENVLGYEPEIALYVEEDNPLVFYREIMEFAIGHLTGGGHLYFECNEGNAAEVVRMLRDEGFGDVLLRPDMQGKDRMVRAAALHKTS